MRRLCVVAVLIVGSTILSFTEEPPRPVALSERPGGDLARAAVADGSGGFWVIGNVSDRLAVTPDAMAAVDAALDATIKVLLWHRRLAGDARKRHPLLAFIYKGA